MANKISRDTKARSTADYFTLSFSASANSTAADLVGRFPIAIENVASGPTSVTIDVLGADGTTYKALHDSAGTVVTLTLVASKYSELPDSVCKACMGRTIRLVNGGSITKDVYLYVGS